MSEDDKNKVTLTKGWLRPAIKEALAKLDQMGREPGIYADNGDGTERRVQPRSAIDHAIEKRDRYDKYSQNWYYFEAVRAGRVRLWRERNTLTIVHN